MMGGAPDPVTAADAGALAAIHAEVFPPSAAWDAATMASLLGLAGVFGYRRAGQGFILVRQVLDEAEILTLAVRVEARRRGLGAVLVETAAATATALGAERMLLEVAEENAAALALYRALEFEPIGLRRNYYSPGMHAQLLRRWLRPRPS